MRSALERISRCSPSAAKSSTSRKNSLLTEDAVSPTPINISNPSNFRPYETDENELLPTASALASPEVNCGSQSDSGPEKTRLLRKKGRTNLVAMDTGLLVPGSFQGPNKQRQVQDARDMYRTVQRSAERANSSVPPYDFIELIGKGGYGRVYKCKKQATGELVAVKILNIDDADFQEHFLDMDNTIKSFHKEVSILQQLKDSKAKNVNMIHDAFDLHNQLWIVSDYCTGGSLRTLMRANPTSRRGFEEQFLIPIARELAVAIKSVHDIGVIHRDIKCANVYVSEEGDIQLGDFGIVGDVDDGSGDYKRRTIVGTPHYLPREMHVATTHQTDEAYSTEVDIWSYGITIYEAATGLPPYANISQDRFHTVIDKAPRLEGGDYSDELRDFIAFCLNSDPKERPSAEAVLMHPYVANTSKRYPTSGLVRLIERYATWEYRGGQRQSLWAGGGAAAPVVIEDNDGEDDEDTAHDWSFSTSEDFNVAFGKRYSQMMEAPELSPPQYEAPPGAGLPPIITQNLTRFELHQQDLDEVKADRGERSLDRLFNPDTVPYQLHTPVEPTGKDLPLREMASSAPTRESMIDLDGAAMLDMTVPTFNFDFGDVATLRAKTSRPSTREDDDESEFTYGSSETEDKRATMEWKFPGSDKKRATMDWTFSSAEPAEPDEPGLTMKLPPAVTEELPSGYRPMLKHTATEPVGQFRDIHVAQSAMPTSSSPIRDSIGSMIDLDSGLADPAEITRPSTAMSATGSTMTDMTSGNPFDLEEDPEQNELDRNRFSYHKQWHSEGGPMKRLSHRTMQMHSRGSSLTSTDSETEYRAQGTNESVFDYNYSRKVTDTMRSQMAVNLLRDGDSDISHWPSFGSDSSLDEIPQYPNTHLPELGDAGYPLQQGLRTNGLSARSFSRPREPSRSRGTPREMEFVEVVAPHPDVLLEDADPAAVVPELDRLLEDLERSLRATSKALRLHTGVHHEDVGSGTDSGFDSSTAPTGDEDGF